MRRKNGSNKYEKGQIASPRLLWNSLRSEFTLNPWQFGKLTDPLSHEKAPMLKLKDYEITANFVDYHESSTHKWNKMKQVPICSLYLFSFFLWLDWHVRWIKACLHSADGFTSNWHDLRKQLRYFAISNFGDGSVMTWTTFLTFGKSIATTSIAL